MKIDSWIVLTGSCWLIAALIMLALWLLYLIKDNPSIVDIGWSTSIGCVALYLFFAAPGFGLNKLILLICVLAWSLRLTALLLSRMIKGQKDQRYVELSVSWKNGLKWKYFLFFQAQALSVIILLTPVALAFNSGILSWNVWDTAGLLVFIAAFSGEVISDHQMVKFRGDPKAIKKVCNIGFWRYSRHPNYFFEWIIWISYALFAMNHPAGYIGWISPALILVSILKVTGIPPTEKRLLASKKAAYKEYQRTTSSFFPLPPKK